jgi:uncharacterized membrane protein
MLSKVRVFGHPLHAMLVAFPIASYVGTFASVIAYALTDDPFWFRMSLVTNIAGVATASLAALAGMVDYATVVPKQTVARRTGAIHGIVNSVALVLFIANLVVQQRAAGPGPALEAALALTGAGVLLTLVAGFFGWEMVQSHHIGVKDQPDEVAVEDTATVAGHWMEKDVTESQVLGAESADDDEGRITQRWESEGGARPSGPMARH